MIFGCSWSGKYRWKKPDLSHEKTLYESKWPKEAFLKWFQQWEDHWEKCSCKDTNLKVIRNFNLQVNSCISSGQKLNAFLTDRLDPLKILNELFFNGLVLIPYGSNIKIIFQRHIYVFFKLKILHYIWYLLKCSTQIY